MGSITYLDIILVIPIIWFAWKGFKKGLIIELASLAALVLGIFAAWHFSDYTEGILTEKFDLQSEYLHIIAFALTFIIVVVITHLIGKLLESVVKMVMLGFVNKLAGLVFGTLKIALVLSGIFYILSMTDLSENLISKETKEKSLLYEPVASLIYIIMPVVEDFDWKEYDPQDDIPVDSLRYL